MKKKWFYALAGTFMIFTSCQENENSMMETSMQGDGAQLKYDSTLELVEAFRDHVNQNEPKTKTLEEELVPISVEKKVLTVKMPEDANLSRTLGIQNQEEGTTEVVLETIKFQKDGTYGFAIATNDPRLNSVYAYTEDGQLSDTIFNIGLAETLSKIPLIVEKEIENYYTAEENGNETTRALNGEVIGPLVKTAWNQTAPYNDKLGTCSNGEHVVAGCVTVAVAQTIAYYDYPVSYSSTYNLSTLRNQKYIYWKCLCFNSRKFLPNSRFWM